MSETEIVQGAKALDGAALDRAMGAIPGWDLSDDRMSISRDWQVKNFVRAAELANVVAWLAESANHHPDISFGWGHVRIVFSTHSAKGVTMNDIIMATRINAFAG